MIEFPNTDAIDPSGSADIDDSRLVKRFEPLGDDQFKRMAAHLREIQEVQKKLGLADNGTPRNS